MSTLYVNNLNPTTGSLITVNGGVSVSGSFAANVAGTFGTFTDGEGTPSVATGNLWKHHNSAQIITDFLGGTAGQTITVISTNAITYDVTTSGLKGGSVDIVTASGDVTVWTYDGTDWHLIQFMDATADMSGAGGDVTAVTAGDGLSGGGAAGAVTLTLDLSELTAASVADGDFIPIIDTNDSSTSKKEAVADLATLFAGTGLTAASSVIGVDASQAQVTTLAGLTAAGADGADLALTYDTVTITDDDSGEPQLIIKTTNTTAGSSGELQFLKDADNTGDGEVLGQITFYGEDGGASNTQFAGIKASISESDATDEAGTLELQVAESNGTDTAMTTGLKLEGEHATDGQIDVTIGAGAASDTTVAGNLVVTTDLAVDGVANLDAVDIDGAVAINPGSSSGVGLTLTHTDTDAIAYAVAASNQDADVMTITADALTTGDGLNINSNSANSNTRRLLGITNTHASAAGTILLHLTNAAPAGASNVAIIESSAAETGAMLEMKNTNAATDKPITLNFARTHTTVADDMSLGKIAFEGKDSAGSATDYATITADATDVTNQDEGGKLTFSVRAAGTAGTAASTNLFSIGGEDVANSTQCEVVVNDAGINCDFRVEGGSEANLLHVDASADAIGIGNPVPGSTLEISKVSGQPSLELSAWSTTATAAHASALVLQKSGIATLNTFGANAHTTAGEILGRVEGWGATNDGDGSSDIAKLSSYIEFANDAVSREGTVPGKIVFATTPDSDDATPTVRLTIDDGGLATFVNSVAITTDLAVDGVANLDNTDIDGTFTMDGTTFDVNATAAVTIDGTTISIDGTDDVNLTVTSSTAAEDLTIQQIGANDSSIIITAEGTGDDAIKLNATAGSIDIDAAATKDVTINAGQVLATAAHNVSEAIKLHADAGASQTIQIINDEGTTDGSEGAGAIDIEATVGGISLHGADDKDIAIEAGQVVITANHDTSESIKLHAPTGASQTIQIINDAGTTDGTEGAGAIDIEATVGGISLHGADDKDIAIEAGQVIVTANHDTPASIKLHADAGTSQTIQLLNDAGTGAAAIDLTSTAGGITLASSATTAQDAVTVSATQTTKNGLTLTANALTSGDAVSISSTSTSSTARSLLKLANSHASAAGTSVIEISQVSTGPLINAAYGTNGSNVALKVKEVLSAYGDDGSGLVQTITDFIPAGSIPVALAIRCTVALNNNAVLSKIGFINGSLTDDDYYLTASTLPASGAGSVAAAGTTMVLPMHPASVPMPIFTDAELLLTFVLTSGATNPTAGTFRVVLYYYDITAPSS